MTTFNFKKIVLLTCSLLFLTSKSKSQVLIPATSYEDVYPIGPPGGSSPSCYSFSWSFSGTPVDTYLSAINGTLVWRLTSPSNPSSIINQGTIAYPGAMDMSVGFMYDGVNQLAVVAYYQPSVGHFYDVYKWNLFGLSLISSTPLSTMSSYSRISIDSHKSYGMVIVWEDATDIYCVAGLSGVFTPPILLGGTTGMQRPDVAFSHSPSGLLVQFVYNNPTGPTTYEINETMADFYGLYYSGGFYMPLLQDINPVVVMWSLLTASIDAPDHYSVDNWGYVYAIDGVDVYSRTIDYNTTGVPVTTNLVDGLTFGNAPMWAKELSPKMAYNKSCKTYHAGWYSSFGAGPYGDCYYNEEIKESASGLVSSPDYLLVANNSMHPPGASLNSIAFSKQNDNSPFLYTVFLDNLGIHHVWHKWTQTTSFRSSEGNVVSQLADNCAVDHSKGRSNKPVEQLSIGPNPFSDQVRLLVPVGLQKENMKMTVTDISGKVTFSYDGVSAGAQKAFEESFKDLSAGTYFVNASIPSKDVNQNFKLVYSNSSK